MTHVCAYLITFVDGSIQYGLLHSGSADECYEVMQRTPSISYDGDKSVCGASIRVFPEIEWEWLQAEQWYPLSDTRH